MGLARDRDGQGLGALCAHAHHTISACAHYAHTQTAMQSPPATAAPKEERKLWGGRFTGKTDPLMEKFNESLPFDKRMWAEDIQVQADVVSDGSLSVVCSVWNSAGHIGANLRASAKHTAPQQADLLHLASSRRRAVKRTQRPWQRPAF